MLGDTKSDWEYGRPALFSYLLQQDGNFLKNALAYLKKTGGLTSWKTVFEGLTKKNMSQLTQEYYDALVTKGSIRYVLSGTYEPWGVFNNIRLYAKDPNSNLTDQEIAWHSLGTAELKPGAEQTGGATCSVKPYGAQFIRLDLTGVPANHTSFSLQIFDSSVTGTLFDISGDSYSSVTAKAIEAGGTLSGIAVTGHHYLLMLVNATDSTCSGVAVGIVFGNEGFKPVSDDSVTELSRTYSGKVSYYYRFDEYRLEDATASVTINADGRAKVELKSEGISKTYEGTYDPSTGMIGTNVFIRPRDGFGTEANGNPRLYEGGITVTIHDTHTWNRTKNGSKVENDLLVFNSEYTSEYPELDLTVTWNNQ